MKKYRRIEVNAYHRRVTVVSGEWRPDDLIEAQAAEMDDGVSLNDSDACEPVAPDSPEGQLILVEAVRTLEQRLTPETRALICTDEAPLISNHQNRNRFYLKLRSIHAIIPKVLRFNRERKETMR
jgi:hypothetical protein